MYPNSQIYLSGIFVHEQVKALKKLGVDVTVFAPVPYSPLLLNNINPKWKSLSKINYVETFEGVKIYHPKYFAVPAGILKQYWSYKYYHSALKMIRSEELGKFDLIHAHGSIPDCHAAYLLAKNLNIPYVQTVHGSSVYAGIKRKQQFVKIKIALENADEVVGVSTKVIQRVKKYTNRKSRMIVIHNGFIPQQNVSQSYMESGNIKILFGATLVERKGCKYVLEAFKKISASFENVKLVIAGGGPLLQSLKSMSDEFNLSEKVEFLGVVSHERMLDEMQKCNIFILPSWDEAFGVVYLEAMSFAKPVIGTIEEGVSDIIQNGKNGFLVRPRNTDDIVDVFKKLVDDEKMRVRIGKAGYDTIQDMTWENNAKKYIELYDKVISDKDNDE